MKSLGSSGVSHLVVANELDPADIPVVSSRVTVVKVQVRRGRGHLVVVTLRRCTYTRMVLASHTCLLC